MTRFFLDTNVLFKTRFVGELARHCTGRSHRVCVSALVHMERVSQLRRKKGDTYDPAAVEAYIKTHDIEIVPFDRDAAEYVAQLLSTEFPSDVQWQVAKWRRCASAAGQVLNPPASPRCPATLDWLIARHAAGGDTVIVSDDLGSEFTSVRRVGQQEALEIAMAARGYAMIAIAMVNRKGGVGKTTLTLALADFLNAIHGYRILVVDMDPQSNASLALLGEERWVSFDRNGKTVADIFAGVQQARITPDSFAKALVISGIERVKGVSGTLSLIPCTPRLQQIEEELMEGDQAWRYVMGSPYFILHAALSKEVFPAFDFVLIDCPPALGVATLNGLTAANGYIMPTIADHVSIIGVSQMAGRILEHGKGIRREIKRYGTVVNRFDLRTNLHRTILAEMRVKPEFQPVWDTIVPQTVRAEEAYATHDEALTLRGRYGQDSHIYFQALGQLAEEFIRRVS